MAGEIPDDLAKKVSEMVNNKRITPSGVIVDELEEMARDITLIKPNPMDWEGWIN